MAIQKFPLAAVSKVRQYIQNALALVEIEQQSYTWTSLQETDELPEPESLDDLSSVFSFGGLSAEELPAPNSSGRWFVSTVNPAAALLKLPVLRLKPEFRLVSYLCRTKHEGIGVVFAVPEALSTTAQLEEALANSGTIAQPPQPKGRMKHFMEAIEGDCSPTSFLIASIVRRELQEFGAWGQRCSWSHHRLIDTIPPRVKWQWQTSQPKDLSPKVKVISDGQAAVEFFTCRIHHPIAIYRHLDYYPATQYKPNSLDKAVALAQQ
jgi:hypothetical protein